MKEFEFYREYFDLIMELKNENDRGEVLVAIFNYVFEGKETILKGLKNSIYKIIILSIDLENNRR